MLRLFPGQILPGQAISGTKQYLANLASQGNMHNKKPSGTFELLAKVLYTLIEQSVGLPTDCSIRIYQSFLLHAFKQAYLCPI